MERVWIRELIDRYHAAINSQNWTLLESVFAEDAVWEALAPINLRFEGRAAILDGLRASVLRQELLVQTCAGVVITIGDETTGTVESTLIEFGRETGGAARWSAVAFYSDEVRLEEGDWRFVRRTLRVRYLGAPDLSGQTFALTRPD